MEAFTTYLDPKVTSHVANGLSSSGVSFLRLECVGDFAVNQHKSLVVFFGTVYWHDCVVDAWICYGGDEIGLYNTANYTSITEAACQHIGKIVLKRKLSLDEVEV